MDMEICDWTHAVYSSFSILIWTFLNRNTLLSFNITSLISFFLFTTYSILRYSVIKFEWILEKNSLLELSQLQFHPLSYWCQWKVLNHPHQNEVRILQTVKNSKPSIYSCETLINCLAQWDSRKIAIHFIHEINLSKLIWRTLRITQFR